MYEIPAIVVFVLSLAALIWAWRGRRVGDHPFCRKCGFDLFGLPPDSTRCPECGSDLSRPRAAQVGERRVRIGSLCGALLSLFISATWLGAVELGRYRGADTGKYKPIWWLKLELQSNESKTRVAALGELSSRFTAGSLSQPEIYSIADVLLASQGDLSKKWLTGDGDFIEALRKADVLSDERWSRYLRQGIVVSLRVRPRVRAGDPVPYEIVTTSERVGTNTSYDVPWAGENESRQICGREQIPPAEAGRHILRLNRSFDLNDGGPSDYIPPLGTTDVSLESTFIVAKEGEETVRMIADESMRAAVEKSLVKVTIRANDIRQYYVELRFESPPVGLGYRVSVRSKGEQYPLGTFAIAAHKQGSFGFTDYSNWTEASTVDVILCPDNNAALQTIDVLEVWSGEIVLKGLKIEK